MPVLNLLQKVLALAGRNARLVLPLGLLAGIFLPSLAGAIKPFIGELIALMLFLASLRIGPRSALGALGDIRVSALAAFIFQLAIPLSFAAVVFLLGLNGTVVAAIALMLAASPISGTPNLVIMLGHDPAPALRTLIFGTAVLPLTAFFAFWAAPGFGDTGTLLISSLRLLAIIAAACAIAFMIRGFWLPKLEVPAMEAIDGMSALVMGVVVVGLMSAVGVALENDPASLGRMLVIAFAANFGLQIATAFVYSRLWPDSRDLVGLAVSAGNRNCALFLTALPASVTEPLLLFIGCYQIPMYLTPMLLSRFYRNRMRQ
jgi:ACR3 family arsenite transporter